MNTTKNRGTVANNQNNNKERFNMNSIMERTVQIDDDIKNKNHRLKTQVSQMKVANCASLMNIQTEIFAEYAGMKVISAEEFQKVHKENGSAREVVIANVDRTTIEWKEDCVKAMFKPKNENKEPEDGFILYYDGSYQKIVNNKEWKRKKSKDRSNNSRLTISFQDYKNSRIYIETMILMLKDLDNGKMLERYGENINCNVISCTGNKFTANKIGMEPWFDVDNLEWTIREDNIKHGKLFTTLVEKTGGRKWLASANDGELWAKVQCSSSEELIKYCEDNLFEIV